MYWTVQILAKYVTNNGPILVFVIYLFKDVDNESSHQNVIFLFVLQSIAKSNIVNSLVISNENKNKWNADSSEFKKDN